MPDWLNDIGFQFEQADWFMRLVIALASGALLGIDREVQRRRIRIRTYQVCRINWSMLHFARFVLTIKRLSRSVPQ